MPTIAKQPLSNTIHEGTSYNPTPESHASLLKQAQELKERKLKKQQKIEKALTPRTPSEIEENIMVEEDDDESETQMNETAHAARVVVTKHILSSQHVYIDRLHKLIIRVSSIMCLLTRII